MLWDYLSNADLQHLIDDSILQDLDEILQGLEKQSYFNINQHSKLVRIVAAFIVPDFFRSKKNILKILNSLPPDYIDECIEKIKPEYLKAGFEEKIKLIADNWWRNPYNSTIIDWAGLSEEFKNHPNVKVPSVWKLNKATTPYKVLKDYQIPVFLDAQKALQNNNEHFIIQMPTGSGKTRTAMEIVSDFLNAQEQDIVIVWLAHSEELCEQAMQCFFDVWEHVSKKDLEVFRCWGDEACIPSQVTGSAFMVASFQKMYSAIKTNNNAFAGFKNKIKLVIVDEAHKVLAPTYKKVTRSLQSISQGTRIIGLTATPGRHMDDPEGNKALSDFFLNKSFTIRTDKEENPITFLRKKKVLAKLSIDPVYCSPKIKLSLAEKDYLETHFDFPPGFLKNLGQNQVRNIEILEKLKEYAEQGKQILFFACSVEHSKLICPLLIYLGYKAAHVDGATDKHMRQEILQKFKNKEIQILCNFGVLSTGFDAPNTDVVCIARPTRSIVLYSQMIGRGLRGPAIGGTEHCTLISVRDNIDNLPNYTRIFNYFEDYWTE